MHLILIQEKGSYRTTSRLLQTISTALILLDRGKMPFSRNQDTRIVSTVKVASMSTPVTILVRTMFEGISI